MHLILHSSKRALVTISFHVHHTTGRTPPQKCVHTNETCSNSLNMLWKVKLQMVRWQTRSMSHQV